MVDIYIGLVMISRPAFIGGGRVKTMTVGS